MRDDARIVEWGDLFPEVALGAILVSAILFGIGLCVNENHRVTKYLGGIMILILLITLIFASMEFFG